MKKLGDLHEDFYPIPVRFEFIPGGGLHLADYKDEHLTKSGLIRLVRVCGGQVHRGSIKNYTFAPTNGQLDEDLRKILRWANQILRLMEQHRINLASGHQYWLCAFSDPKGALNVWFAVSPLP